jgi:hypothetical protein
MSTDTDIPYREELHDTKCALQVAHSVENESTGKLAAATQETAILAAKLETATLKNGSLERLHALNQTEMVRCRCMRHVCTSIHIVCGVQMRTHDKMTIAHQDELAEQERIHKDALDTEYKKGRDDEYAAMHDSMTATYKTEWDTKTKAMLIEQAKNHADATEQKLEKERAKHKAELDTQYTLYQKNFMNQIKVYADVDEATHKRHEREKTDLSEWHQKNEDIIKQRTYT